MKVFGAVSCLFTAGAVLALAQPPASRNPHNSPEDVAAGGRIFRSHCAVCHGLDGSGGRGSDLTRGTFRHAATEEDLYHVISSGIEGTEMPGIFFDGRQLWQLVAYVQSLSEKAAPQELPGDPAKGKEVFEGKGGCLQCHMVSGRGSAYGPDLSDIGAVRSAKHLKVSLTQPNETVFPQYFQAKAVTTGGDTLSGIRLNEDTFSVQLRDAKGQLHSLLKEDLQDLEILKTSTMPSYEGLLSPAEIDDVVAYLSTLRRDRRPQEAQP